jgi:hypothetical protein
MSDLFLIQTIETDEASAADLHTIRHIAKALTTPGRYRIVKLVQEFTVSEPVTVTQQKVDMGKSTNVRAPAAKKPERQLTLMPKAEKAE